MEKLSDFKPLERVVLPNLGELDCSGLILVVGPNSSGKTQLLRDLYHRTKGDVRELVVAQDISLRKPDMSLFLLCLEREGYLKSMIPDEGGTKQFRPMTTYAGTGEFAAQAIPADQAQRWYESYPAAIPGKRSNRNEWLLNFGRFAVTALFLERRLSASNQVGVIDFENQPPQNDLHALYLNDEARGLLLTEMQNAFGKAVWPDTSRGTMLSLKVSGGPNFPTAEDRLSAQKSSSHRTIESEGDGLKSYVATCIALLLGRRPVCLVDEPEMCLHPPQAYNLGRFIGKFGSSSEIVTFVATHSSHVLRGVIETAPKKLQIVRLMRRGEAFEAHLVKSETLTDALKKPAIRAESMLDGIFSEAVVVVEADTDRTVYQAAWETVQGEETPIDIHFATVGGSGGIADTCNLYRTLKIPVAVIADLDLLVDRNRLGQVLTKLTDEAAAKPLVDRAAEIGNRIKGIPPTLSPDEVQGRLKTILSARMDWSQEDDANVQKQLDGIAQDLDRMKRLKRGGIGSLPHELQGDVNMIVKDLAQWGLFLVPVGELEQWFGPHEISVSKLKKPAWANAAAEYVRSAGSKGDGVWQFVREVARFLSR